MKGLRSDVLERKLTKAIHDGDDARIRELEKRIMCKEQKKDDSSSRAIR
jgi:hypothetical protein